jgi:hypothetical protein
MIYLRSTAARWLVACLALAAVFAASCGDDGERSVVGVIIEVQATSLTEIDSFTLRDNDGRTLVFRVAQDAAQDPQEGFLPGHLRTHALAVEQVTVFYREEDGGLLALRLEDP